MTYDTQIDDEAAGWAVLYASLMPWCRARYFDDQSLWGDEPVGTGLEFFQRSLNGGEQRACVDALAALEHTDEGEAELLGKGSGEGAAPKSS